MSDFSTIYKLSLVAAVCLIQGNTALLPRYPAWKWDGMHILMIQSVEVLLCFNRNREHVVVRADRSKAWYLKPLLRISLETWDKVSSVRRRCRCAKQLKPKTVILRLLDMCNICLFEGNFRQIKIWNITSYLQLTIYFQFYHWARQAPSVVGNCCQSGWKEQ